MSGSARKIESKARRKNMRAWKRKKTFDLMAAQGEYQHPELLFNGEVSYWQPCRIVMSPSGHISGV